MDMGVCNGIIDVTDVYFRAIERRWIGHRDRPGIDGYLFHPATPAQVRTIFLDRARGRCRMAGAGGFRLVLPQGFSPADAFVVVVASGSLLGRKPCAVRLSKLVRLHAADAV